MARHCPLDPEGVLAEELAVHHGHPPVAATIQLLAGLMPVAEVAQDPAHLGYLFPDG